MNNSLITTLRSRLATAASGALLYAALGMTPAHAVLSDGLFELDGNAADPSGAALPDDWESFPANTAHTLRATGIVSDTVPAVFRNGSKDTQDVSAWRYDLGSSPPKDNMLHGYAAAYTATTTTATTNAGDLLIYFGADRDSFTGTASLGFWFFKNPIARNDATGSFVNPVTGGAATHAEGDVLVAFEYTNGGAVTGVRVFRWQSGALADLGTIGVSATNVAGVFCDPLDEVCGSTNGGSLALSWNGTIAAGQFFEGGVNISKLLPNSDSCFAAFMATSRSSDQPNASIKNFILSSFPVCHLTVTKVCEGAEFQAATNNVLNRYKGRVLNDGGGPLTNITLVDNPAFATLNFLTCDANGEPTNTAQSPATLAAGASICYRATNTSNTLVTNDTVTASASTGGSGQATGTASATCTAPAPDVALQVTKTCDVDLELDSSNKLALKVNFGGSVTNTGGATLTGVKVCEAHEISAADASTDPCSITGHAEFSIGTLAPGATQTYGSSYYPTTALTGGGVLTLTDPELAVFKDKAGAQGTKPAILGGGTLLAVPVEASCPLCK
jgi:hypothetical protein